MYAYKSSPKYQILGDVLNQIFELISLSAEIENFFIFCKENMRVDGRWFFSELACAWNAHFWGYKKGLGGVCAQTLTVFLIDPPP